MELDAELDLWQLQAWLGKSGIIWSKSAPFSVGVLRSEQLPEGCDVMIICK